MAGDRRRPLRGEEKIRLALLAMPTLALALAITMVSTYLSEVTRRYTHQTALIGLIIGSEGIMAWWVPLLAGSLLGQRAVPHRREAPVRDRGRRAGGRGGGPGRLRRLAGAGRRGRGRVLRLLLRRLRALPRHVSRPGRRAGGGGACAEHAGAGARAWHRARPARGRAAAERRAAPAVRGRRRRADRRRRRVRAAAPAPRTARATTRLRAKARSMWRPPAAAADPREPRPARLPVRQRAVGADAGRAEGVHRPVPDARAPLHASPRRR